MQTILPDFKNAALLVVGDLMLDRYCFGETDRISPEAPVPVVKVKQIDERPGGAANVAMNLAALGAHITLLGILGLDEAATTLKKQLTNASITHSILQFDNIPTITKLRVISRQQQLIRLDFEEGFPAFDAEKLLPLYQEALKTTKLVILSDYGKGTLTDVKAFIRYAREADIPVLIDPKGRDFSLYSGATLITPNLKEFETIVGPCKKEKDIIQKGVDFLKQYHIQSLLLTRGERGMLLIQHNKEVLNLPAYAREVYDVTGAGDTVIAVLGAAYAAGASLPEAIKLANLAASLVVSKLGTASISLAELQMALHNKHQSSWGIVDETQLKLAVACARMQGKKIVFTNGCFDILHAGHLAYLQQAKQLGDYLVVAINDDHSIKQIKGPGRPINPLSQRMALMAGLDAVDWVISFKDLTPERLLKAIQPDILVKGGDYSTDEVVGAPIVQSYGGEVRVLGLIKDISTSIIIDRLQKKPQSSEEII